MVPTMTGERRSRNYIKRKVTFGEIRQMEIKEAAAWANISTRSGQYAEIITAILTRINKGGNAFALPDILIDGKPLDQESAKPLVGAIKARMAKVAGKFTCRFSEMQNCLVILPKDQVFGRG